MAKFIKIKVFENPTEEELSDFLKGVDVFQVTSAAFPGKIMIYIFYQEGTSDKKEEEKQESQFGNWDGNPEHWEMLPEGALRTKVIMSLWNWPPV